MILPAIPALIAAAYYFLALIAVLTWGKPSSRSGGPGRTLPPVSILKAVHGRDPRFYEAIRSHAEQEYPEFEILFGLNTPDDPSLPDIERLRKEFPNRSIRVLTVSTDAPNAKAGVLAALANEARSPLILVNDSDIKVEPGYLLSITRPLEDPGVGLVTCLYRAWADSWPSRAEALGVTTEFAPSVMVARLLGVGEFALGSTMLFRAEVLPRMGGFEGIADYLADDYQLGARIRALGYRIEFAPDVVETDLGGESWRQTWRHQVRWSRTIRVSRPGGYFGYGVTHATVWALLAFAAGQWWAGTVALAVRMAAAIAIGGIVLRDRHVSRTFWLIPFRDLFGFAVWLAGLFGTTVQWRDRALRLNSDGKIRKSS